MAESDEAPEKRMYRHLLVPIDDSEPSVAAVGQAVEFARTTGARVTFMTVQPQDGASDPGAGPKPGAVADDARAILARAEAAARAADIEFDSLLARGNRPYEAIIDVAEQKGCDLIFMASHARRQIANPGPGSQTREVLARARVPVLVTAVENRLSSPQMDSAIATIQNEHRSIAAVVHAMQHKIRDLRGGGDTPDFPLFKAMLTYLRVVPESLHHPKEDRHLFARLSQRTTMADEAIAALKAQHEAEHALIADIEESLAAWEGGAEDGLERVGRAVENYAEALWPHMSLEEKGILPVAYQYLLDEDWVEIDWAFWQNGDPRFDHDLDSEYKNLFARLMNWAAG